MFYSQAAEAIINSKTSIEKLLNCYGDLSFDSGYLKALLTRRLIDDVAHSDLLRQTALTEVIRLRILLNIRDGGILID